MRDWGVVVEPRRPRVSQKRRTSARGDSTCGVRGQRRRRASGAGLCKAIGGDGQWPVWKRHSSAGTPSGPGPGCSPVSAGPPRNIGTSVRAPLHPMSAAASKMSASSLTRRRKRSLLIARRRVPSLAVVRIRSGMVRNFASFINFTVCHAPEGSLPRSPARCATPNRAWKRRGDRNAAGTAYRSPLTPRGHCAHRCSRRPMSRARTRGPRAAPVGGTAFQ